MRLVLFEEDTVSLSLGPRGTAKTGKIAAITFVCRTAHNTVINASRSRSRTRRCMKMQNRKAPDAAGNKKQIRQRPPPCERRRRCDRRARQPQQNPDNSDTNEVCKVYKCSSASFVPGCYRHSADFYLDCLARAVVVRGEIVGGTRIFFLHPLAFFLSRIAR